MGLYEAYPQKFEGKVCCTAKSDFGNSLNSFLLFILCSLIFGTVTSYLNFISYLLLTISYTVAITSATLLKLCRHSFGNTLETLLPFLQQHSKLLLSVTSTMLLKLFVSHFDDSLKTCVLLVDALHSFLFFVDFPRTSTSHTRWRSCFTLLLYLLLYHVDSFRCTFLACFCTSTLFFSLSLYSSVLLFCTSPAYHCSVLCCAFVVSCLVLQLYHISVPSLDTSSLLADLLTYFYHSLGGTLYTCCILRWLCTVSSYFTLYFRASTVTVSAPLWRIVLHLFGVSVQFASSSHLVYFEVC